MKKLQKLKNKSTLQLRRWGASLPFFGRYTPFFNLFTDYFGLSTLYFFLSFQNVPPQAILANNKANGFLLFNSPLWGDAEGRGASGSKLKLWQQLFEEILRLKNTT